MFVITNVVQREGRKSHGKDFFVKVTNGDAVLFFSPKAKDEPISLSNLTRAETKHLRYYFLGGECRRLPDDTVKEIPSWVKDLLSGCSGHNPKYLDQSIVTHTYFI